MPASSSIEPAAVADVHADSKILQEPQESSAQAADMPAELSKASTEENQIDEPTPNIQRYQVKARRAKARQAVGVSEDGTSLGCNVATTLASIAKGTEWNQVLLAFNQIAREQQKVHGADGLLRTCNMIADRALVENSMRNARKVMNMMVASVV